MMQTRGIKQATKDFEEWLRAQLTDRGGCDERALKSKHREMRKDRHAFLRGTFYRWVELWHAGVDPDDQGTVVPVVGDAHVENFGTWRDAKQRLIWGVNDFDEACELPWTSDLVRVGVSASLACRKRRALRVSPRSACEALWQGYREALASGIPRAAILDEESDEHGELRELARRLILQKPDEKFWDRKYKKREPADELPVEAAAALVGALPSAANSRNFLRPNGKSGKPPGLGSRGKRRYYLQATWQGGPLLLETKPVTPSALAWVRGGSAGQGLEAMLGMPWRARDPYQQIHGKWIVRRLAPDASKIELGDLAAAKAKRSAQHMLFVEMGRALGNLHAHSAQLAAIRREAEDRDAQWLCAAVERWEQVVRRDYQDYRK